MTFGLTLNGFIPKTLTDVKTELEDGERATFGQSVRVDAKSVFGQINGVFSGQLAELWEVAQVLDAAFDPDRTTGSALDSLCAITGTTRLPATKTSCTATCTGTPGTSLAAGRVVSVLSTGTRFTLAAGVIVAVSAWVTLTAYTVGQRVTRTTNVYECTIAGTTGATGPSGTGSAFVDGTVTWRWIGAGTGVVDVLAEANSTGPFVALADTLRTIETPVSGWSSVTNLLDATVGSNVETDAALRLRREDELAGASNAASNAIRAKVLKVGDGTNNPVTTCRVFQNTTMTTDGDGIPPKAIEVLVQGGEDQEILDAIFGSVAAGIETYGTESGTVTDDAGYPQTVKFSRPNEIPIYVVVHVYKDPAVFPTDGEAQVKEAIAVQYAVAKDVTASACGSRAFQVAGVLDVPLPYIGIAPAPGATTTIVCGARDLAVFDTSRVSVTLHDQSP